MLSFSPPSGFANSNSKRLTHLINLTRSRKLAGLRASWRISCFQLQVCGVSNYKFVVWAVRPHAGS